MPLSPPVSPTTGQLYTANGRTWSWTGAAWELVAASGGSGLSWSSVPASATATGVAGSIAYDNANGFFYVATATNTWKRAALATWTPFTPASISGLQGWYDASDASTLYDATSGGSLVAADGAVARWQDKSGNANHVTQSDSSSRPLRRAAGINGLTAIEYDGTNDFLAASGSVMPTGSAARTVIAVYRPLRTTGVNAVAGVGSGAGSGLWFRIQFRDSPAGDPYFAGFAADLTDSTGISQTIKVASLTYNGTTGTLYRNGAQIASSSLSLNTQSNPFSIGGDGPSGSEYAKCYICEVLVYNSALSSTDRAAAESYLMTRWGIT